MLDKKEQGSVSDEVYKKPENKQVINTSPIEPRHGPSFDDLDDDIPF